MAASVVTFLVQKKSRDVLARLTVDTRLENALVSYVRYLAKTIFPRNLSVLYPYPDHWPLLAIVGAGGVLAILTVAAIWTRRSRPYFATGWFWFLGMLVPVIGLVQVGEQSMADRYFYLPSIGLFIVAVWGGTDLMNRAHFPKFAIETTGVTILVICALRTSNQLQNWRNSETLFRHAIAVTTNNYSAYIDLGSALSTEGFDDKASECFNKAIAINPNSFDAYNSLGTVFAKQGKTSDAENCFQKAIEINPRSANALNNLGVIAVHKGNAAEAENLFRKAILSKPDYADAYNNLGRVLAATGRADDAIIQYHTVLELEPHFPNVCNNLAVQLSRQGKFNEAVVYYDKELKLNPDQPKVHLNYGNVLALLGRRDDAITQFKEALRLDPNLSEAQQQLSLLNSNSDGK